MKGLDPLEQFFAGYFHQDWDLDDSSWEDVVRRFKADVAGEAGIVAELIRKELLSLDRSDQELSELIWNNYGCYYRPQGGGTTMKEWLTQVQELLIR
jgi:hypothetical protein